MGRPRSRECRVALRAEASLCRAECHIEARSGGCRNHAAQVARKTRICLGRAYCRAAPCAPPKVVAEDMVPGSRLCRLGSSIDRRRRSGRKERRDGIFRFVQYDMRRCRKQVTHRARRRYAGDDESLFEAALSRLFRLRPPRGVARRRSLFRCRTRCGASFHRSFVPPVGARARDDFQCPGLFQRIREHRNASERSRGARLAQP